MKIIIVVLVFVAIYCINAECPNCIAENCGDCTKSADCVWCNDGCLSKYAKILCETRIEDSASCPVGLCAVVRCMEGTVCIEEDGKAVCVENNQTTNPCAAISCPVNQECREVNGSYGCVPMEENPCAVVLCPTNTVCTVVNGSAECEDRCATLDCASGSCVLDANGNPKCTNEPCTGTDCPITSKSVSNCAAIDCVAGYHCEEPGDCVPSTCTYHGKTYQSGDSFPSDDGCNQCGINCIDPANPEVVCTLMACIPPPECKSNDECTSGLYCEKASCDSTQGFCKALPEACLAMYDPVCGCDGQTYGNKCTAANAGVNVDHSGECECDGGETPNETSSSCDSRSFYNYILSMNVILAILL